MHEWLNNEVQINMKILINSQKNDTMMVGSCHVTPLFLNISRFLISYHTPCCVTISHQFIHKLCMYGFSIFCHTLFSQSTKKIGEIGLVQFLLQCIH